MNKNFYITTPIYYANDIPHIGHTGTTVYADIAARYKRALGFDVLFLTGTDEHGEKIATTALKNGKEPQPFVDELVVKWKQYWETLNISNDVFMRTTMPEHKAIAQELLTKLYDKGDIYKALYKGIYCVGCEEFKSEKDLVDGKCPEHRPDQVSYREEENYFFKLSKYIPQVKKYMEDGTLPVVPENKKNEMLARLNDEIKDSSVSRSNLTWGVQIPWDKTQVTYVWIEALMNYYTATRIWHKEDFWPADVHFLGKGNNWFHSVIWPALLLALDLPLPKKVFVHGYYNVEGKKMGKSLGNVISPQELMDRYGVDGTRYLLAASMPYENDSDVSWTWFDQKYNSGLANGLGNLSSRLKKMVEGLDLNFIEPHVANIFEKSIEIKTAYEDLKFNQVIELLSQKISKVDEYLSETTPWKKEGAEKAQILEKSVNELLEIALLISPITPTTSDKIIKGFLTNRPIEALFPRIK